MVVVVVAGFNVINQAECAASHGVFIAIQVFAVMTYVMSVVDAKVIRPPTTHLLLPFLTS